MKKAITIIVLIVFASCNTVKNSEANKGSKTSNNIFANTKRVECPKNFEKRMGTTFINK